MEAAPDNALNPASMSPLRNISVTTEVGRVVVRSTYSDLTPAGIAALKQRGFTWEPRALCWSKPLDSALLGILGMVDIDPDAEAEKEVRDVVQALIVALSGNAATTSQGNDRDDDLLVLVPWPLRALAEAENAYPVARSVRAADPGGAWYRFDEARHRERYLAKVPGALERHRVQASRGSKKPDVW